MNEKVGIGLGARSFQKLSTFVVNPPPHSVYPPFSVHPDNPPLSIYPGTRTPPKTPHPIEKKTPVLFL